MSGFQISFDAVGYVGAIQCSYFAFISYTKIPSSHHESKSVRVNVVEVSAPLFQHDSPISADYCSVPDHACVCVCSSVTPLRPACHCAVWYPSFYQFCEIYLTTVFPSSLNITTLKKSAHVWLIAAHLHDLLLGWSAQQSTVYSGL